MKSPLFLLSFLFLLNCTSDSDMPQENRITPSDFLVGTWVSQNDPIRLTFKSNNIIEENLNYADQFWTTDFVQAYSNDEFEISESTTNDVTNGESYSITVARKDGKAINTVIGNTTVYRKYTKAIFQGQESILLSFPGYTGVYLFKE